MRRILIILVLLGSQSCKQNSHDNGKKVDDKNEFNLNYDAGYEANKFFLDSLIIASPKNANLYHERSKLNLGQLYFTDALQDIRMAFSIDSTKPEFFVTLSDVYIKSGNFEIAKIVVNRAVTFFPEYPMMYFKKAEYFATAPNENLDSAFFNINRGLKQDISNPFGYYLKGLVYKKKNNTESAISSFLTSIEQDPTYYEPYLELGFTYFDQNDLNNAEIYLSNAILANPKRTEGYYARGSLYMTKDSLEKAKKDFNTLLGITQQHSRAMYSLGSINLLQDSIAMALTMFEKACKVDTNYFQSFAAWGYCLEKMNRKADAKVQYQKAISIYPEYTVATEGIQRLK